MSYSVQYHPEMGKKYPTKHTPKSLPGIKAILIVILIAAGVYILTATEILRVLIPGDPQVTATAASCFVERVEAGEPMKEAIILFFKDVVVNGA